MFTVDDLIRIGTSEDSSVEIRKLAYYCMELQEVIYLMDDDEECLVNEREECGTHGFRNWLLSACPHERARRLLGKDFGDSKTFAAIVREFPPPSEIPHES